MAECKHHKICGLNTDENSDEELCILHSNGPKDEAAFNLALKKYINQNKEASQQDYRYFVFPEGADLPISANVPTSYDVSSIDFSGADFKGHVDFSGVIFRGYVAFAGTRFGQGATFSKAKFQKGTSFYGAVFDLNPVIFENANFVKTANFSNMRILRENTADFTKTKFGQRAEFSDAVFTGTVIFTHAEFQKGADFFNVRFDQWVSFASAAFRGLTLFAPRHEEGIAINNIFTGGVDFTGVSIEPPDALIIRDADLRNCRLLGTDLRKAEITGAIWPKICFCSPKGMSTCLCEKTRINFCRYGVYDEIHSSYDATILPWHHLERLYRELKQNCEDRRDYERVGDFHYGEKEMRRKNLDTSFGLRTWLRLYQLVAGYGERWLRPVICAIVIFAICTVGYIMLGLVPAGKEADLALSWKSGWDWLRGAFYSFRVMTLLKPVDLEPIRYAKLVHAFESLLGPLLIGLFALALRQRLRR